MPSHRAVYIGSQAILLAREKESFKLPELENRLELNGDTQPSRSTIRRVLQQLEEDGWLTRDHPEGRTWKAGPHVNGQKEKVVMRPYLPPIKDR